MNNKKTPWKLLILTGFVSSIFVAQTANAIAVLDQQVNFSTSGQSMWSSDSAIILDKNQFVGLQWDKSAQVDLISGSENTHVPGTGGSLTNPLYAVWQGCIAVTPSYLENRICGSAPSKTVANPIPAQYKDTRSGVAGTASTSGRVGFEVGLTANSGSVDSTVGYDVSLDVPDSVAAGQYVNLLGSSSLNAGSLDSTFPTLEASLSLVAEASASFTGTGCILLAGCTTADVSTGTLGGTFEMISVNQNGEGSIEYFDGNPILNGLLFQNASPPTGLPATVSSSIASVTAYLPNPNADGGLDTNSDSAGYLKKVQASGQDDLLDLFVDVDNIVSLGLTGTPYAFGGELELGALGGIGFNLLNVEMGPTIDLKQEFEFTPTLYVDLDFSQPVDVLGLGNVTQASNLLFDNLPQLAFMEGETWITPTLFLGYEQNGTILRGVELLNELFLDVDGELKVDVLDATFSLLSIWDFDLGIGNIFHDSLNLFTTPAIYSNLFGMGGFQDITLDRFLVTTDGFVASVPEANSFILLIIGLLALAVIRRKSYAPYRKSV